MLNKFILSLLLLWFPLNETFTSKVIRISDGDTIVVMQDSEPVKIRLYGIDCPEVSHASKEIDQPFGPQAMEFTKQLVDGKEVKIIGKDIDQYGRTVAIVELSDGRILNEELLKAGFAWHYQKYDSNTEWQKFHEAAKAAGKGLWAGKNPIAPWDWRHEKMALAK